LTSSTCPCACEVCVCGERLNTVKLDNYYVIIITGQLLRQLVIIIVIITIAYTFGSLGPKTLMKFTCPSRWTVAGKSVYLIFTRSVVFTRTTITFVGVRLATSTCIKREE